jgi:hypothetical protein
MGEKFSFSGEPVLGRRKKKPFVKIIKWSPHDLAAVMRSTVQFSMCARPAHRLQTIALESIIYIELF